MQSLTFLHLWKLLIFQFLRIVSSILILFSVLYPPFVYEQVSMEGIVAGELFAASGKVVKSAGWKDVYENTDDTEEDEDTAP